MEVAEEANGHHKAATLNGKLSNHKLHKTIQSAEDYLDYAKMTLNHSKRDLQECTPVEMQEKIEKFKKDAVTIFGELMQHGERLFKAIDECSSSMSPESSSNGISVEEPETNGHATKSPRSQSSASPKPTENEDVTMEEVQEPDHVPAIDIVDEHEEISPIEAETSVSLSQCLEELMTSNAGGETREIVEAEENHRSIWDVDDEEPSTNTRRIEKPNKAKKTVVNPLDDPTFDLPDDRPELLETTETPNPEPGSSTRKTDEELCRLYNITDCEIAIESSLMAQVKNGRLVGLSKEEVKKACKAVAKMETRRTRSQKKPIDSDESDEEDVRNILRGTKGLLNDSDMEDSSSSASTRGRANKTAKNGSKSNKDHSNGPSTSSRSKQTIQEESEESDKEKEGKSSVEEEKKSRAKQSSKSPSKRPKVNKITSSGSEDEQSDKRESDKEESDKDESVEEGTSDEETDLLLNTKLPKTRSSARNAAKDEVKKSQSEAKSSKSKRRLKSSSSADVLSDEFERIDVEESSDDESKTSRKRATRGAAKKEKKAAKSKPKKRRRIALDSDEEKELLSGEEEDEEVGQDDDEKAKKTRFKPMMSKKKLTKETINAELAERERRKRLEERQKQFNGIELAEAEEDLTMALSQGSYAAKQRVTRIELDPDDKSEGDEKQPVRVHEKLVRVLKPHQAKGIKFIYDSLFERLEFLKDENKKDQNYGGILAHSMGLGKTLTTISFVHTVLTHPKTSKHVKRVLVLAPKNVVINWRNEFQKWLEDNDEELATIDIFELSWYNNNYERLEALKEWYKSKNPSVAILGYELFRILTEDDDDTKKKKKKNKKFAEMQKKFREFLQNPGPDIVVCDEAHKLKNDETAISKTVSKIVTKRRLCLTGTPLQNNLMEYHCMVSFVKPGILGTKKEFANRFKNIIERGKHKDASQWEVRAMRKRCHVLYDHLQKVLDRKDYRVLSEAIPAKNEFLIKVRLTPIQIQLYKHFLGLSFDENTKDEKVASATNGRSVLQDYHVFSRIWTHPYQLIRHEKDENIKRMFQEDEEDLEDFVVDSDEETPESGDSDIECVDDGKAGPSKKSEPRKSRRLAGDEAEEPKTPETYRGWFADLGLITEEDEHRYIELSNKLALLIEIIKKCESIGDKLLVFSQSIESLTLIRRMLTYLAESGIWWADGHECLMCQGEDQWAWYDGLDYLYIDGQVSAKVRDKLQGQFNDPNDLRARLMLISTKAGSLGTNMIGANRVVIFDACWNPSHDTQSLFRVYRFGQTKPVYIYRFIAQGTMEERIYKRQVTKESTAMRVIDESQIKRHFEKKEVEELYEFDPNDWDGENPKEPEGNFDPRTDRLLADIVTMHKEKICEIQPHDSLFVADPTEMELNEDEKNEAWAEYEREKTNPYANANMYNGAALQAMQMPAMMANQQQQQIGRQNIFNDTLYMQCFGIIGMSQDIAARVTYIKRALDELLPKIPKPLRGGISEFGTYFMGIIQEAYRNSESPQWLLNKTISVFRTVVNMVKDIEECKKLLKIVYASNPQLFDTSTAHLFAHNIPDIPTID